MSDLLDGYSSLFTRLAEISTFTGT